MTLANEVQGIREGKLCYLLCPRLWVVAKGAGNHTYGIELTSAISADHRVGKVVVLAYHI